MMLMFSSMLFLLNCLKLFSSSPLKICWINSAHKIQSAKHKTGINTATMNICVDVTLKRIGIANGRFSFVIFERYDFILLPQLLTQWALIRRSRRDRLRINHCFSVTQPNNPSLFESPNLRLRIAYKQKICEN